MLHDAQHGVVDVIDQLVEFLTHIRSYRFLSSISKETAFSLLQVAVVPHLDSFPFTMPLVKDIIEPFSMWQALRIELSPELETVHEAINSTYWLAVRRIKRNPGFRNLILNHIHFVFLIIDMTLDIAFDIINGQLHLVGVTLVEKSPFSILQAVLKLALSFVAEDTAI